MSKKVTIIIKKEDVESLSNTSVPFGKIKPNIIPKKAIHCPTCNHSTDNKYEMEIHHLLEHSEASSTCLLCSKKSRGIIHHLKRQHPDVYKKAQNEDKVKNLYRNDKALTCKFCGFQSTIQYLTNHIKHIHIAETVICDQCSKTFKKTAYAEHLEKVHAPKSNYYNWKCDPCHQLFKHELLYQKHLKCMAHKRLVAKNSIDYKEIEKKVEEMKKKYKPQAKGIYKSINAVDNKCSECKKTFNRQDLLDRHYNTVHNKHKIKCELCNKNVAERNFFERHIRLCLIAKALSPYPGHSKWERIVSKYLIDNDIDFDFQHEFDRVKVIKCLSYDFYIPKINYIIEINGKQHYEVTNYRNAEEKFKEIQRNDKMKLDYLDKNNISYLIIDTRKYDTLEKIHDLLKKEIDSKFLKPSP